MSETKIKDVYLDIDGVIDIMQKRGVMKNYEQIAKEFEMTTVSLRTARTKAPKQISSLNHFLKENMLRFEDLVKEVETKNNE